MSYQIKYTAASGETRIHNYSGSVAGAESWARTLSQENGGRRAECTHIADGLYDRAPQGTVTHVITVGDDSAGKK